MQKFKVTIEMFDRDALEWAAKLEALRLLMQELNHPYAEEMCTELRDVFTESMRQVPIDRLFHITKIQK